MKAYALALLWTAVSLMGAANQVAAAEEAKVADISVDDLKKAIADKKVTLLDCNGTESFNKGHIPGAIDFAANKEKLAELLPKEKGALVVAYCGNEKCNAYLGGAAAVQKLAYSNVKHLAVGIAGWTKAGEKTEAAAATK